MRIYSIIIPITLAMIPSSLTIASSQIDEPVQIRDSVVKIFTTQRQPNFESPWIKQQPSEISGTGFVIDGDRILTNAHVVSMGSQIFVQPPNSADKLRAEIVGIAQGIDLAIIEIRKSSDREDFHENHQPLTLNETLPEIGSTVQAIGYPMGGEQISLTEGVVSRIEFTAYAQGTAGLRVQVDAALNHGNSGGPVVQDDQVVGVVFSGVESADNIGYLIPVEEVVVFIEDIDEDNEFDGRPTILEDSFQTAENPGLRSWLDLDDDETGLLYTGDAPDEDDKNESDVPSVFEKWDLIDSIGGYDIDNAGMITIGDDLRLLWGYMIPRLADENNIVQIDVLRDGHSITLDVPVTNSPNNLMTAIGDDYPEYFIIGPMVFSPARLEHLMNFYTPYLAMQGNPAALRAGDIKESPNEEIVLLVSDFLPHSITKGYDVTYKPALKSVNGTKITSLEHLVTLLRETDEDYLEFAFYDLGQESFVFDREELFESTEELLEDNSIRKQGSKRFMNIWDED